MYPEETPATPLTPTRARLHAHFVTTAGGEVADMLVAATYESLAEALARLRAARAAGDVTVIGRTLHRVRGALLTGGLAELADKARALEGALAGPVDAWQTGADALEGVLQTILREEQTLSG